MPCVAVLWQCCCWCSRCFSLEYL